MDRSSSSYSDEDLNSLLTWLDADRERAWEKYENIKQRLIKIFAWRHASDPEDLADETITRVARKVSEISGSYVGDPSRYFYGMAKVVLHQYNKRASKGEPETAAYLIGRGREDEAETRELEYDCLHKCMLTLTEENRKLLLIYYGNTKEEKIKARQVLATEMGSSLAALRIRIYRLRTTLKECISKCMESHHSENSFRP